MIRIKATDLWGFVHRTHHEASAPSLSLHQAVKARTPPPCSYLTEGALKVVFQKSIPAQIRQLILGWLELEQRAGHDPEFRAPHPSRGPTSHSFFCFE